MTKADDIPAELSDRLAQIAQPIHQGDVFRSPDYWTLSITGLVIPAVLMLAGWFM